MRSAHTDYFFLAMTATATAHKKKGVLIFFGEKKKVFFSAARKYKNEKKMFGFLAFRVARPLFERLRGVSEYPSAIAVAAADWVAHVTAEFVAAITAYFRQRDVCVTKKVYEKNIKPRNEEDRGDERSARTQKKKKNQKKKPPPTTAVQIFFLDQGEKNSKDGEEVQSVVSDSCNSRGEEGEHRTCAGYANTHSTAATKSNREKKKFLK